MELHKIEGGRRFLLMAENHTEEDVLLEISQPSIISNLIRGVIGRESLHDRISKQYANHSLHPKPLEITRKQAKKLGQNAVKQSAASSTIEEKNRIHRAQPLMDLYWGWERD